MAGKKYEDYWNDLKKEYEENGSWESLKEEKANLSLLTGAGVTSCLVGNWNELLNELAVLRGVDKTKDIKPQAMINYLNDCCGGKFLADDINTLEKGEYLRYSPTDQCIFSSKEKMDQWRETVFAGRVSGAIDRLINRHLCDGLGRHKVADYRTDFLNWLNNTADNPFGLGRRELCDNRNVEKRLETGFTSVEIAHNLNACYGLTVNVGELKSSILAGKDVVDTAFSMFSGLLPDCSEDSIRKRIRQQLTGTDPKKDLEKEVQHFLAGFAAYLLWRPSYDTLETLLSLCINRRVKCVVTYNFDTVFDRLLNDDVVQEKLSKGLHKKLNVLVYGIHRPGPYLWKGFSDHEDDDSVAIYHVHGVIDNEMEELEEIIFSETSYRSYQEQALNRGSIHLANAYDRGSLLCVGFSGVDPNFRSIVGQMVRRADNPVFFRSHDSKAFLARSLEEITKYYGIRENMDPSKYDVAFRCADTYLDMLQHYIMNKVGMEILWSENHSSMAKRLNEFFEK